MSKFVTISELEQGDDRQPIWALNGSADSEVGQPGEVHVGIPKLNGTKIDPLHLPQTWLPINLTDQIPRAQLLASSEFRNAVNNKLITLISPEFADQIGAQDGVQEERERLVEMRRAVREATAARSISQSGAEVISTSEISERNREEASEKDEGPQFSPGFVMFANNLENKSDIECLNLIRSRGKFSRPELKHLIKTLHDKSKTVEFIGGHL